MYQIEAWDIVKWLGGLSVIIAAIVGFVSYIIQNRLLDKWKSEDNRKIEQLKAILEEKILSKKIEAMEKIW